MSRSYRHNPIAVDSDCGFKRIASKATRHKINDLVDEDGEPYVLNYAAYRKLYDSYLIHDYKSFVDVNSWCEEAKSDEEFEEMFGDWERLWHYK